LTDRITTIVGASLPVFTIVGLIVLLALNKIDQSAGIGLIGALAGVHGGQAIVRSAQTPPQ
jgi:hypothetical protein